MTKLMDIIGLLSAITLLTGISIEGASLNTITTDRKILLRRRETSKALFRRNLREVTKNQENEPKRTGKVDLSDETNNENGKPGGQEVGGQEVGTDAVVGSANATGTDVNKDTGKLGGTEVAVDEVGKEADGQRQQGRKGGKRGGNIFREAKIALAVAMRNVDNDVLILQNPASTAEQVKAAAEEALKNEEAQHLPREVLASISRDPNVAQSSLAIVRDKGPVVVGALEAIAQNPEDKAKVQEELTKVVLNRLQLVPANLGLMGGSKQGDRRLVSKLAISPSQEATGTRITEPAAKKMVEEAQRNLTSQAKVVDDQIALIQTQGSQPAQIEESAKKALVQQAAEDFLREVLVSAATDANAAMQALAAVRDHGPKEVIPGLRSIAQNSADATLVKKEIEKVISGRKLIVAANLKLIELSGGASAATDNNQASNAGNNTQANANNAGNNTQANANNAGNNAQANANNAGNNTQADANNAGNNVQANANTGRANQVDNTKEIVTENKQTNTGDNNKQVNTADNNRRGSTAGNKGQSNSIVDNTRQANTGDDNRQANTVVNNRKVDNIDNTRQANIADNNRQVNTVVNNRQVNTDDNRQANVIDQIKNAVDTKLTQAGNESTKDGSDSINAMKGNILKAVTNLISSFL